MGHCSLTPRQRTKGWLRPSCTCSSSFQGGGQQHRPSQPLPPQELWEKPVYCSVCSRTAQLGETQALFVCNSSCTTAPLLPQEPSPPQLRPWMQWRGHREGETTGIRTTTLLAISPRFVPAAHPNEARDYGHLTRAGLTGPMSQNGGGVPPPLVSILTWLYTHFLVIQAAVSKLDTISITTAASKGPFKATTFAGFHCKIGQCQMSVAEPKSVNVQMK